MSEIETLSLLFDSAWYLATYQDVTLANCDPLEHYLSFGYKEGRNPNRFFNTRFYLTTYTDIAECHLNPFIHYILYGASEGRLPRSPHEEPLPAITFEVFLEDDIEEQEAVIEEKLDEVKQTTKKAVNKIVKNDTVTSSKKPKTVKKDTKQASKDNVITLVKGNKTKPATTKSKKVIRKTTPQTRKHARS